MPVKKIITPLAAAFALLLTLAATAVETSDNWRKLAERELRRESEKGDDTTIDFRLFSGDGPFDQLRLRAVGSPVLVQSIKVVFSDKTEQELTLKRMIKPQHDAPIIKLINGPRALRRVTVKVSFIGASEDATMQLWARTNH
jgi:hypothetical protein